MYKHDKLFDPLPIGFLQINFIFHTTILTSSYLKF